MTHCTEIVSFETEEHSDPRAETALADDNMPFVDHEPVRLAYCGVLHEWYEFLPSTGDRCPLCGFRPGEL
jgi:hypothetical protein